MPTRTANYDCAVPPAECWSLRDDDGFEQYSAGREGNTFKTTSRTVDEEGVVTRVASVTAEKNPIPSSLRKMLGCVDGFTFVITEKWHPDRFDAANPMTFVTTPAVFPDRIFVNGSQWVEPNVKTGGSTLFYSLTVKVKNMNAVGPALARGISSGTFAAYKATPARASEFIALRRASIRASHSGVDRPLSPRASASGRAPSYTPPLFVAQGDGAVAAGDALDSWARGDAMSEVADEAAAAAAEAAAVDAARRQRARRRWRLALMSVRFRIAVEEQQTAVRRIMAEGWVRLSQTKRDRSSLSRSADEPHTCHRLCRLSLQTVSADWVLWRLALCALPSRAVPSRLPCRLCPSPALSPTVGRTRPPDELTPSDSSRPQVDAPKTEGFGPSKATTFRVCMQASAAECLGPAAECHCRVPPSATQPRPSPS